MTRRVLLVTGEYPPMRGGIGDYTSRLVEALPEFGWDPLVLTSRAANRADSRVLAWVGRWDWSAATLVRRVVAEREPDVVHIQYQTGAFNMHPVVNLLPYLLRRGATRRPVITTFHDLRSPYLFPKAGAVREGVNKMMAAGSAALVVTNERDRRMLSQHLRVAKRVVLIPIGSNLPRVGGVDRDVVRERLGVQDGERAIGFFGFLTQDKGVEVLIDALERLRQCQPHLVVIGGGLGDTDVANESYHRRLRERLKLATFPVSTTGHLSPREAAEALAALDLIVLPFRQGASLRNGSLIAAIGSGTPVVTTDPGPDDSLGPLTGGENIWLVPPGDVGSLERAIDLLLHDGALRLRLATSAGAAAAAFDWRSIAERHAELYDRVLECRERAARG